MKRILSWSAVSLAVIAAACGGHKANEATEPSFTSGETVVNLTFADFDSVRDGYVDAFIYAYDGLGELPPTKVGPDGKLSLNFDLNGDAVLFLMSSETGDRYGALRIAPGETAAVTIYPDSMAITGKFAELNKELYNYVPKYSLNAFFPDFVRYDMSGDEYTACAIAKYNAMKDSLAADTSLSPMRRSLEESSQLNSLLTVMANRPLLNRCSYIVTHPEARDIPSDSLLNGVSDANIASVIAVIDPDSPALLEGTIDICNSLNGVDWSEKGAKGTLLGAISDYQLAAKEANACRTDSARLNALKAYSNPFFAESVERIRATAQKRYDDAVSMINQIPTDLPGEKIIETIAAPYKGKVVMIDLWNTWCSPCKAAIAANEPLKETTFADPDIVWVYIADESSPMNVYVNQIPKIKGEHYRITANQAQELHKQFNLDGIPYYILVDREGDIQGRPDMRDHEVYEKSLLGALKK